MYEKNVIGRYNFGQFGRLFSRSARGTRRERLNQGKIPAGWEWKQLGDVCIRIVDGSHNPPVGINFSKYLMLSSKNIINGKITFDQPRYLSESDFLIENQRTQVLPGDVLLTIVGTIGRVALIQEKHKYLAFQRSVAVLRPNKEIIDPQFLLYSLMYYQPEIEKQSNGNSQKGIYLNQIEKIEIPIPPLPEQRRISAIIEKKLEDVEKLKKAAKEQEEAAEALVKAYLREVFEFDELPEGWEWVQLGDICSELFAGGDVPKHNCSKIKTAIFNIPIYTNGEKDEGLYGYTNEIKVTKPSVTVSARGTIGYSVLREPNYYPAIRLIVLTPNSKINVEFLNYSIKSINFRKDGTSIPQLTVPMIQHYSIPLPPLAEQRRIAAIIEKKLAAVEKLKTHLAEQAETINALPAAILRKAFAGEM